MKTVKEIAELTGISVRTLHYYDSIGLLKPAKVTEAGYRFYNNASLQRLQAILLFRQLRFPLKEIREILDSPGFDPHQALEHQIHMLELQREHLDKLIDHARQIQKTGVMIMNFAAFDNSKLEQYAAEAKDRWGSTEAYQEYEGKTKKSNRESMNAAGAEMMTIFARMGEIRSDDPASPAAQALVAELQQFITDHYYTCTREILRGLGEMYTADERFAKNIDNAGGEGTATFAAEAIRIFCGDHN